jgi:hypothetical protein
MDHGVHRVNVWYRMVRLVALAAGVVACESERAVKSTIPATVPIAQIAPLAFTADVDVTSGRITITSPTLPSGLATLARDGADQPSLSILGAEAVRLVPTNYQASPIGTYAPNKIRVTFDVTIENRLPSVAMTTPTWPQPPGAGVMLFPLDYEVTVTPDAGAGGGSPIILTQPGAAIITPSVDWNGTGAAGSGSPYSFFNDTGCMAAVSDDCFRWIAYDLAIQPNSLSAIRTIGFDIDPSVAQFRARMVVAADLVATTPASPATVVGVVTSSLNAALAGVRVSVTNGQSALSSASGSYSITGLAPGPTSVTLTNLPTQCTAPAPASVTLQPGATAVADFLVTCTAQTGMITGILTSSAGGLPIAGATVTSSTGGSTVTNASGAYLITGAGAGNGTLTVTDILATCSFVPVPFVLQPGGGLTLDLVVNCPVQATPLGQ